MQASFLAAALAASQSRASNRHLPPGASLHYTLTTTSTSKAWRRCAGAPCEPIDAHIVAACVSGWPPPMGGRMFVWVGGRERRKGGKGGGVQQT